MTKPRLLDAFSGQGGCSRGYDLAGFDVEGVDIVPQPRYPYKFHLGDAMEFIAQHGHEYDVIATSPPCQAYSKTKTIWKRTHPDLLSATRETLAKTGKPYVIENVSGAPLHRALMLCGTFFGLLVIRHRFFESNVLLMSPSNSCQHPPRGTVVQTGRPVKEGQFMVVAGHFSSLPIARKAMGIDWMTRDGLAQAIPPAYTHFIGTQLLRAIGA
jgi:DNA (cytosine-5)-methyltransferase 1